MTASKDERAGFWGVESTDNYLEQDYNIIESGDWLKSKDDIDDYFRDSNHLFECGQGYFQDTVESLVKTMDGKFYKVVTKAEIGSQKQDRGDRLYWVESIESVTFSEIEKPEPKQRIRLSVEVELYQDGRDKFLKALDRVVCSKRVIDDA